MRPRRLALFARDQPAMAQVWSPDLGYLDDPLYRAPRRDPRSGLALWRHGDAGETEQPLYDPYHAFLRAQEHAAHWNAYLSAELETFGAYHDRPGIAIVPLDAELLGRRWFEGAAWLRALLENISERGTITPLAPAAYLRAYRPRQGATPRDGSWGQAGDHRAWGGRAALPLWQAIGESEEHLSRLIGRFPHARGLKERVLTQAVRELLLAQSSDWMLLLNQGAGDEALRRPTLHLRRCEQLCALAEQETLGDDEHALLEQLEEEDNPFPHLNYRVFAAT
jgi:1,4-alpha-glucan branching enzyme